jgi:NodT family efflux transporter outer membrane factor (OMF) lipoprotein
MTRPNLLSRLPRLALAGAVLLLGACAVGPRHEPPQAELPAAFRHADAPGWLPAEAPAPAADGAPWWSVYGDAALAELLQRVPDAHPPRAAAAPRHRQARALVDGARAPALPRIGADLGATRSGGSGGGSSGTLHQAGLDITWMPDLWGRVARQREAAQADADASAALRDAARLALQLEAAQGYVRVRLLDQRAALMARALAAYERSLQLTRHQYDAGFVARADVIQAETQWQSLRAEVLEIERQRLLEEHALATLAGRTPSQWQLAAEAAALPAVPATPSALPASLLLRRPDVAAAERRIAAANARIGVAQTAWLPDLTLGASGALQSGRLAGLFDAPARVWSLGPALALTLFDGGARRAAHAQALAEHEAQSAAWRAAVLQAVREVEDALASLKLLAARHAQQQRLVDLAAENERVVTARYQAGEITFLEVAAAQNLALDSRHTLLDVEAQRLQASMRLVAALGGGWSADTGKADQAD